MACAWAVMQHLGVDGYVELTRQTLINADRMRVGIAEIDGIRVLGDSRFHLIAMGAEPRNGSDEQPVDMFALGDALLERASVPRPSNPPDKYSTRLLVTPTRA